MMGRIILSAVIAIGFHIALMVLIPSIMKKNNEILPPEIKSVTVTLSYRQPVIKKTKPVLEKKNPVKFPKKTHRSKPVIHKKKEVVKKPLPPVKTVPPVKTDTAEIIQVQAKKEQNLTDQPALKKRRSQKKETIKQAHIKFAIPLYKKNALPAYPVIARKRGYQGIVELMVLVSEKGSVSSLKIFNSSGYKSLDRQAVKTVKSWLFDPGKKNGRPQEMWVRIPVKFELK